jgi:hypothetical protein
MRMIQRVILFICLLSSFTFAVDGATRKVVPAAMLDPGKQFVVDVVRAAVALPQADPQDRLRVLSAAAQLIFPISRAMARRYAHEGARIEAELLGHGQRPAVSMLASGQVDCATAQAFLDSIPDAQLVNAEQSLVGIITACPKQLESTLRKLEGALQQGKVAPRALLAAMERAGLGSRWSQTQFMNLYASLPGNAEDARADAPNYAAVMVSMAPVVEKDLAQEAGLTFLAWLGKMNDSGERNLAINMIGSVLKDVLGRAAYDEALASDPVVRLVTATAGRSGRVQAPAQENVSVVSALRDGADRFETVAQLPASLRARESAAYGFAAAQRGDRNSADRYFQLAFSSAEEVWAKREQQTDAPAVVQEVSEAAAQVDAVMTLKRARGLSDPTAAALSMLAVARVVEGQQ